MDNDAAARVKIFVYGTLLRGEHAHGLLGAARFVAKARTEPAFTLLDMGKYPALVEGGRDRIEGEIYEVDAAALAGLDTYEEAPQVYERKSIELGEHRAFAYVLRPERVGDRTRIASGDWRRR